MSQGTVPLTGTITTTSELDTYPTHWDKYAKGGYRSVVDTVARDAITLERRTEGMQVYVRDIKQLHQLIGGTDNTKWVTLLTIDSDNKVIINNDLNLQKYIIEGVATPLLPNAIPLGAKADGYLVVNAGKVSTTTVLDPAGITLSSGKLLIGGLDNKAVETQKLNTNNLPLSVTDLNLQKYIIEGEATPLLPNAIALSSQADGYLVNTLGKVSTTTSFDPSGLNLSSGKLLIGSTDNKAAETQKLNTNNLPLSVTDASFLINTKPVDTSLQFANAQYLSDLGSGGMLKFDNTLKLLKIATEDVDYATVTTLNTIAAAAKKSADDASSSASASSKEATIATAAAGTATTMAGLADTYAKSAGESAIQAGAAATLAGAAATLAGDHATEASDAADTAKAASHVAGQRRDEAAASAVSAAASLKTLQETGLNALPNSGDVNFKGWKGINVADGVNPSDIATFGQVAAISGAYIKTITGSSDITVTVGQDPTISLSNTTVVPASYTCMNATIDSKGRVTAASSTTPVLSVVGKEGVVTVTVETPQNLLVNLVNTGVTAASYTLMNATVDLHGRITAASSTSIVPLVNGGTGANLTASNGGIFYSTATTAAVLAGTSTSNQLIISGTSAAPSWASRFKDYGTTNANNLGNLFLGTGSGSMSIVTALRNTSFGIEALNTIVITSGGNQNSALGYRSLYDLTTGTTNTAIGDYSGRFLTTGLQCTFLGASTSVSSGALSNVTVVGYGIQGTNSNTLILGNNQSVGIGTTNPTSLLSLGNPSTASSRASLVNLYSTTQNMARIVFTGQEFFSSGFSSNEGVTVNLGLNRTGFRALMLTDSTFATNTTNTALRFSINTNVAYIEAVSTDQSLYTPLKLNSTGLYSNTNNNYTPAGGMWIASSDSRLKKNIKKSTRGLQEVLQLTPVNFKFNKDSEFDSVIRDQVNTGLIADEVEKVMPECVGSMKNKKHGNTRSLNSTPIFYALINSIKELNEKINKLEARKCVCMTN